jgi:ligand-binding SRPBCC domain-containing protein
MPHLLEREQVISRPVGEVFAFFAQARNLERITPPWLRFRVLRDPGTLAAGTLIEYRLRLHGVPLRWISRIEDWEAERHFVDRQVRGPYRLWHHTHEFLPCGDSTLVRDRVRYAVPLDRCAHPFVRRDLERIFDFRREAVRTELG